MTDQAHNPESTVRQKASHRKGRTGDVQRSARVPSQERSRQRYQAIIAATEHLLKTSNIEDISLHDIAKQAKMAPPSVHYLFNTMAAIHVELNRIYNEQMTQKVMERQRQLVDTKNPSWQEWVKSLMAETRQQLNDNRPMSEIMLGPVLHRQSRVENLTSNATVTKASLATMRDVFVVPEIPGLERHFLFAVEIGEALWTGSYAVRGKIDDEALTESVRAIVAYLRCFLPETLVLRAPLPDLPLP